jgi:DNA-binding response OmpR family regulator
MNAPVDPRRRILVVDDDLDLNTTFALMLEFDGHEVRTAYTCEAALLMLEKLRFDLIIAEYWLPAMKGEEFAALVKQKWPDQPIIIMTANIQDFHHDDHPITGVDCFLNKPFTISQLREAMLWVLDQHAENQPDSLAHSGHQETPEAVRKAPKRKAHG